MQTLTAEDTAADFLCDWPDLVVPDSMPVESLAHAWPHVAHQVTHDWSDETWTSMVCCRSTGPDVEATLAIVLQGMVVCYKRFASVDQAIEAVSNSHEYAAAAVSQSLAAFVESLCYDKWDTQTMGGFLDARWRYQLLTGLTTAVANVLCDQNSTYTDLMFLCRTIPQVRNAFVRLLLPCASEEVLWPDWWWDIGPAAWQGSEIDRQRHDGYGASVDLSDAELRARVLLS